MSGALFVFIAPSGSGKTLGENWLSRNYGFFHLGTPTDKPRARDAEHYDPLPPETFRAYAQEERFLWVVDVHGRHYGMWKDGLERILKNDARASIAITPDCLEKLHQFHSELGYGRIIYIYLEAREDVRLERMLKRGDRQEEAHSRITRERMWLSTAQAFHQEHGYVNFVDTNNTDLKGFFNALEKILHQNDIY